MPLKKSDISPAPEIEEKKLAILQAGLKLFGEYGVAGTSVRMIANEANANVASISYYYQSKENLYLQVVIYIGEQISAHMSNAEKGLHDIMSDPSKVTKDDAFEALNLLLQRMLIILVEKDDSKNWAKIIMREQANPTEAFDIIYERFMKPMQAMAAFCVATYLDIDPDSDEVKIRLHALKGQVLGFLVSRESLLRHLDVEKLTPENIEIIRSVIRSHLKGALDTSLGA